METTVGQLMVNEALPPDMRDYNRTIDKKSLLGVFEDLANKYPDMYADINQKLHQVAQHAVTTFGGVASLSLDALKTPLAVQEARKDLAAEIGKINNSKGTQEDKNDKIVQLVAANVQKMQDLNYQEGLKENNPFALQVKSGSRGNAVQFQSLRVGDMMVTDHKDRPIPIPMLKSYAEGLDPVEYWAGSYGARRGSISVKFATPKSGFLGKQLAMASHRLMVTEKDCGTHNGIMVQASDPDNEGAVLQQDVGSYKAGTVLLPKMLKTLGDRKIMIRSPMTCQAEQGICGHCAGIREHGDFPALNSNIGIAAAQALAEPIGQGQLSLKHTGGVISKTKDRHTKDGIDLINQLVQVPENFQGAAAVSTVDGRVSSVENAPQGGLFVSVAGKQHWVAPGEEVSVKPGDEVEAGDVLSSGIPNPAEITQHKGIGEGRRYFTELFTKTLRDNKFPANRRNVELLARGLINHVRVTEPDGPLDTAPDDVVEYDDLVRGYTPRFGFKTMAPKQALGYYLEAPALHYSIGTRITPKVAKSLAEAKMDQVKVHADKPSFVPEQTRAMETLSHSSDWMVRLGGFGLKKGLSDAVQHSMSSDLHGTSFIPSLAQGVEFGRPKDKVGY